MIMSLCEELDSEDIGTSLSPAAAVSKKDLLHFKFHCLGHKLKLHMSLRSFV